MREFLENLEEKLYYNFKWVAFVLLACVLVLASSGYQIFGTVNNIIKANQVLESIDDSVKPIQSNKQEPSINESEQSANDLFNNSEASEKENQELSEEQKQKQNETESMKNQYSLINNNLFNRLFETTSAYCSAYTRYLDNPNEESAEALMKYVTRECFDKEIKPYSPKAEFYKAIDLKVADFDKPTISGFATIGVGTTTKHFLMSYDYDKDTSKWVISHLSRID